MTPAEVAITAALGASLLTGGASLGVIWVRERLRRKASQQDALHKAVLELLTRSIAVGLRARTLRDTIRLRSGLSEGWDVTFRYRKPADPLELHDWQAQDLMPLNAALNEVWTRWDQEGIRLANNLVSKCADLLKVSTALGPAGTRRQRLRKAVIGERWTAQMEEAYERALKDMVQGRKRLADYARKTLKLEAVDLFAKADGSSDQSR